MGELPRSLAFAAIIAAALVAFGCSDDDGGSATPTETETETAAASQTDSLTPAQTAVPPTDERLQGMLAETGLLGFLGDLEDAIEANDVQFLIDHTHFAQYECGSTGGFPAEPEECFGNPGLALPVITYGIWQSEGGYMSEASLEAEISDRLTGDDADDARMYAVGQMTLGDAESPDVADVVVAGLGGFRDMAPVEGTAMSLAIAERDGRWMITEVDSANTDFAPHFYEWWIGWEDFAAAAGLSG